MLVSKICFCRFFAVLVFLWYKYNLWVNSGDFASMMLVDYRLWIIKLGIYFFSLQAEMWNIDAVVKEYGSGTLFPDDVEEGYVVIDSHTQVWRNFFWTFSALSSH